MMGRVNGAAARLGRDLGKELYKTWCGGHRIELLLEHGFEGQPKHDPKIPGVPGNKEFTNRINSVYSFYGY